MDAIAKWQGEGIGFVFGIVKSFTDFEKFIPVVGYGQACCIKPILAVEQVIEVVVVRIDPVIVF